MNKQLNDSNIWYHLVENHIKLSQTMKEFFSDGVDRVSLVKNGVQCGDISTVLYVAHHMKPSELCQLLDELVHISMSPGYAGVAREIILSLPKEWVLSKIEEAVEPILQQDATENEFRRTLELYLELGDHQLLYRLACRATQHSDEDIREAGYDFIIMGTRTD